MLEKGVRVRGFMTWQAVVEKTGAIKAHHSGHLTEKVELFQKVLAPSCHSSRHGKTKANLGIRSRSVRTYTHPHLLPMNAGRICLGVHPLGGRNGYRLLDHDLVSKFGVGEHLVAPCRPRVDQKFVEL